MRMAIRDDDTNYFTTPQDLEGCYHDIWTDTPVTFCVITKVKGDWQNWVHKIYKDKHATDWAAWSRDDEPHPIEENIELIDYLKLRLTEGKADIAFHAKYHRNEDTELPEDRSNNYIRGAEFYTNRDLTQYVKTEVDHLKTVFKYPVTVFTPPQNLLSQQGYRSVINAGLNICGGGITFYKKEKTLQGLANIGKQLAFRLLHKESDYPHVLRYSNHSEIPYHYPLQPGTPLRLLIDAFDMVRSFDGDFVLSTHYVEFNYPMVYDEKLTMKNVLEQFLEYTSKFKVDRVTLSALLKNRS